MLKVPNKCVDCGRPINADNPQVSSGGNLDYEGVWTTWALGACCREPLTEGKLKTFLEKTFLELKRGT